MSSRVEIQDIQIRLGVTISGVRFTCSWYGPKDKMRFAAYKGADHCVTDEEIYRLEAEARQLFAQKILELESKFTK